MADQHEEHAHHPGARGFGALLRELRLNYFSRIRPAHPGEPTPRMRLSALALIQCLEEAGYTISAAAYSEIEAGVNLPRDGEKFLAALSRCLRLENNEREILAQELGYDVMHGRLGVLSEDFERASHFGYALRKWRRQAGLSREALVVALADHGFTPPGAATAGQLAHRIAQMEAGERWPLADDVRSAFIRACAEAFGTATAAGRELAIGMATDSLQELDLPALLGRLEGRQ